MRKFNFLAKTMLLFIIAALFNSCEESELQPEVADLNQGSVLSQQISVTTDNVLAFDNLKSFLSTKDFISTLTEVELEHWKRQFQGFTSADDISKKFIKELSGKYEEKNDDYSLENFSEKLQDFYRNEIANSEFEELFYFDGNSYQINLFDPILSHLVDANKAVKIGSLFYIFDFQNIRVMKSADYSLIDEVKGVEENNRLVDIHIAIQDNSNQSSGGFEAPPALPSLGSTTSLTQLAQWASLSDNGEIKTKMFASRWGFPVYELVSPCPNNDPFGDGEISLECEVFTGNYAYTTSTYIEAWTTRVRQYGIVFLPDQVSRALRVDGRVSFPTLGIYDMLFDLILTTNSSGPLPDFSPSYKRLYIFSYQGQTSVQAFEASISFVDSSVGMNRPGNKIDMAISYH